MMNMHAAHCLWHTYIQVDPMEVWLRDESDDSGHFPGSEDGCFNLNNISAFTTMIVEGPPVNGYFQRAQGTRGQSIVPSVVPTSGSSVRVASVLPPPPIYRSVTAPKKAPVVTIKVVKAKMKLSKRGSTGNPEFDSLSQMYVELTEATANITHVTELVRNQWGTEYTVVSAEGIEIADSTATQGKLVIFCACMQP